ncbi:MAG: MaoC family dehydratase N-terminal domain-containing protein [Anaerolineae bacterium]|nr:MaoC family dehydratase N-terminal domain-containing protein [Anaerolineae bacterium]
MTDSDSSIDLDQLLGYRFDPITYEYTERDVAFYALGVGAPADWLDQEELKFVYENSGTGFVALPTFAVIFPTQIIHTLISGRLPGLTFNPLALVHGEQYVEIKELLPVRGRITSKPRISAVYDKGSGVLIVADVPCYDEHDKEIAFNQSAMFIRGLGGFGGERGPSRNVNNPPERAPDIVHSEATLDRQALIYRLSGDINPLHADPMVAAFGGFDRPTLHGLSTFGFAARAVLKHVCGNSPARFKSIRARFAQPVFPGDMLTTEMWIEDNNRVIIRTRVAERDAIVLSNAVVEIAS